MKAQQTKQAEQRFVGGLRPKSKWKRKITHLLASEVSLPSIIYEGENGRVMLNPRTILSNIVLG
jgi:hypothetical protein